jgi:phosphoenolpyruvate carboxykinase (ATP)
MRSDGFDPSKSFGTYRIFHAPDFNANAQKLELRSETAIAMDLEAKEILICGTLYAGEIKKSLFSVLNYILPDKNILPMHAGSNVDPKTNDVSVFFGLSGTGKTTLSTQESRLLIGDDEHGLSDQGIFNFEGGCYAKTYKLSKESEPEIFKAANTYGALLENVVLAKNNAPDFDDMSLAENGRCAYPLNFIEGIEPSSKGGIPSNMFFLTADAFGVLPPVSLLSNEQAKYYFLSGYTAKLAGTEMGVTEPQATFSTCFGAPFMMRPAGEYAELLGNYIKKYNIKVWLINTGWSGGVYGVGSRFPLKTTRRIIDAIQHKELDNASFETEAFFGLKVPTSISGVDAKLLSPIQNWSDSDAFKDVAKKLATMFKENFKRFSEKNLNLIQAGPRA